MSRCLSCINDYYLFNYQCIQSECPDFSYEKYNDFAQSNTGYCEPCHYSCLTCNGPSNDQCTTCCQNGFCGATMDRDPMVGQCNCPAGTSESNGICNTQCSVNLQGRLGDMCYTKCPHNSYSELKYDQLVAQEVSQFDAASSLQCENYINDLKFKASGKGLAVAGPPDFQDMPNEFTVSMWIFPMSLSSTSTFINAFSRVKIFAQSSNQNLYYKFETDVATSIQPSYTAINQQMSLNSWNYVVVSQRQVNINNILYYEIQVALAQSNNGAVLNTAYSNNKPVVNYGKFTNILYLGADSDVSPQSFTGYLKEVKLFSNFRSFAQIVTD